MLQSHWTAATEQGQVLPICRTFYASEVSLDLRFALYAPEYLTMGCLLTLNNPLVSPT